MTQISQKKEKYSKTLRDTTSQDTNLAGTRFEKGLKDSRGTRFWDMNLAGHDFKKWSKIFVILHLKKSEEKINMKIPLLTPQAPKRYWYNS